jgi:putative oxidoreductase
MLTGDNARLRDYGLTVLRIGIGVIFLAHGYMKFFKMGIGGTTSFMSGLGVPAPALAAWFAALAETLGGVAFILGIFTPVFGLALALDMAGAILFAKKGGFFAPKGFELELSLLVASVALAFSGPGALALRDALSGRRHAQ